MKPVTLEETAKIKLMVYGESGVGKTYLIGTFTQCEYTSPVLVLDAGGQPISFRAFPEPPLILQLEGTKDLNFPYTWLKAGQPWGPIREAQDLVPQTPGVQMAHAVYDYFGGQPNKFKTVAIDSITHVQRISLDFLTESEGKLPGDYTSRPQIQHWGQVLSQMTRIANMFYNLPIHVVITALARRDSVEALGLVLHGPFIWGQGSGEVPSHSEIVGRMVNLETLRAQQAQAVKTKYPAEFEGAYNVMMTRGGRTFLAKWQGVVDPPDLLVAPTAQKIMDVILGNPR